MWSTAAWYAIALNAVANGPEAREVSDSRVTLVNPLNLWVMSIEIYYA